jgi:two-component system cell cycle sensor histidine kinase/response regulator CckA
MENGIAILVVEDELPIRRLIRMTLMEHNFLTLEASNGLNALSVARSYKGKIAVAIVDLMMPEMGGLDFVNQLGIDRPETKVLYISGYGESVAVESLTQEIPRAILKKPFSGQHLMISVQALISDIGKDHGVGL